LKKKPFIVGYSSPRVKVQGRGIGQIGPAIWKCLPPVPKVKDIMNINIIKSQGFEGGRVFMPFTNEREGCTYS
jgi:hypothetical protein